MVIAITNQKSGVAKTTTSLAFSSGLRKKNFKTLIIDLDPQANVTFSMDSDNTGLTIYDALTGRSPIESLIQYTAQGEMIPSNILLSNLDSELASVTGKEYRLREAMAPIVDKYDYIIIDTPPVLSTLTINALTSADRVIIPVGADIYSIQGVVHLSDTIETVKKYCNKDLIIDGIVLTRYNGRTILAKDLTLVIKELASKLGTFVYDTVIFESISIKEAQAQRLDILDYSPNSKGAKSYMGFIEEFINRNKSSEV